MNAIFFEVMSDPTVSGEWVYSYGIAFTDFDVIYHGRPE